MLSSIQSPRLRRHVSVVIPSGHLPLSFPSPRPSAAARHSRRTFHLSSPLCTFQPQTETQALAPPSPPQSQILSIRQSLLSRSVTAVDLVESHLARLNLAEPHVRSFLHISDSVLREAREIDRKIERNEDIVILAGVMVGVSDNICAVNIPAMVGYGYVPPFDATAVRNVKECDGIVIGKTNMDEFGMGSTTERSSYQFSCTPGGSSGGSAVAVSARQCMVSLGSDTGGSVRQPASFCGVVGLKPTYGRVSRYGLMAYASSLDVIGCFGNLVADAGILLHAISGHDKLDATCSKRDVPDFASQFISASLLDSQPMKGLKIGLISETINDGVDAEISSTIQDAASHMELWKR